MSDMHAGITVDESTLKGWGARLRALREESGMTQDQLSERSGISQSMISSVERGKREPSRENAIAWARACGRSVDVQMKIEGEMTNLAITLDDKQIEMLLRLLRVLNVAPSDVVKRVVNLLDGVIEVGEASR